MRDCLNNRELHVVKKLLREGSLEVTLRLEEVQRQLARLVRRDEYLELATAEGPLTVWVSHVRLGWNNRAGHDGAHTVFGVVDKTSTYVRVIVYEENDSCWVEHITTLPEGFFLEMKPVITELDN